MFWLSSLQGQSVPSDRAGELQKAVLMTDQDIAQSRSRDMQDLTAAQSQHLRWAEANGGYLAAGRQQIKGGMVINANAAVLRALARRGKVCLVSAPEGGLACRLEGHKPTIEATTYTRLDGVDMFRNANGLWTVRDIKGATYFWSFATCEWWYAPAIGSNQQAAFQRPYDVARAVLETVKKVT